MSIAVMRARQENEARGHDTVANAQRQSRLGILLLDSTLLWMFGMRPVKLSANLHNSKPVFEGDSTPLQKTIMNEMLGGGGHDRVLRGGLSNLFLCF